MISCLHLVTDDRVLADSAFLSKAEAVVTEGRGRITFHLRGPRTSGRRLWELGDALLPLARRGRVPFLINDRVDLALVLGVDGVQLGRRSLPLPAARRILGQDVLIGCSLHDAEEAGDVRHGGGRGAHGPDFVLAGALFPTGSHPDRPALRTGVIGAVRAVLPGIPVLGIGGITPERVDEVLSAGGHGIAVIRAVWDEPDPADAVKLLLGRIERWQAGATAGRSERGSSHATGGEWEREQ